MKKPALDDPAYKEQARAYMFEWAMRLNKERADFIMTARAELASGRVNETDALSWLTTLDSSVPKL